MNITEEKSVRRLENQIVKFEEILNYCIENRIRDIERPFADLTMIILGNDIKEISSSVLCLHKNNSLMGIDTLNRVALEKLMYLKRVFNSETRSKAFYLKIQLKRIEFISRLLNDEVYQKSFCNLSDLNIEEVKKDIISRFPDFETKRLKVFEEYRSNYDYSIEDNWIYNHTWFNFDGDSREFEKLAEKTNLLDEYRVFYDMYSTEVHSKSMSKQYGIISEADSSYFAFNNDFVDSSSFHKIIFIGSYLHEVITMFFERYRIPKKMIVEYQDSLK